MDEHQEGQIAAAIRDSFILNDDHENVVDALNAVVISLDYLAKAVSDGLNKLER